MNVPELSLCFNPNQKSSFLLDLLRSSTNPSLNTVPLQVRPMLWGGYKEELVSMALYNKGSDVSQVGFPLTEDLISMNALLPIPGQFLSKIGGESTFHPTILKIATRHQKGRIWALPWLVDPRALFYWKDLVDKADVDPGNAFTSAENMEDTCQRIRATGVEHPWVLGMADRFVIIHAISSWVWGKGGDFISPSGDRGIFLEDAALDGMEAFFRLGKYMPPNNPSLNAPEAQRFFIERKAAVTLGPYGCLASFRAAVPPDLRDLLGVALPPGPPLLAGSDLVLWRHNRTEDQVADLLKALFSTEVQTKYAEYMGDLPVTQDALKSLAESGDSNIRTFVETLSKGRLFAVTKFGGMLEGQLSSGLTELWARVSQNYSGDKVNLKEIIKKTLEPVRRRFDMLHVE